MAKVLRDDGYTDIRTRLLAHNAYRALAHGHLDPADAERLTPAYRTRRA